MPHYPGFYVQGIKCEYVSDKGTAYYYFGSSGGEWAKVWARKSDNAISVEYYYEYKTGNYTSAPSNGYSPAITGASTWVTVYPAKGTTVSFDILVSVARRVTVKGDGGSVSTSYTSSLKQASNISSTASGDFIGWFSGDGDNLTAAECTTPVTTANALSVWYNGLTDKTYVAKFNGVLSVGMNTAAGGIISVYLNGNVQPSGFNATVTAGTLVRVVMYAAYNYTHTGWDAVGTTPTGSDYSFYMPHANVTLTAILTQRASVALTLDAVNGNLGEYWLRWSAGSHYFGAGASVAVYQGVNYALTATVHDPIANEFDGWFSGGNLLSADAQYSFTPGASDMTVTAAFSERDAYTIQLQPGVGAYGSYDPANAAAAAGCEITLRTPDITIPSPKWLEGDITVNAVPADGWTLLRWNVTDLDTGSGTFYNPSSVGGTPTNPLTFTLNFNAIIAATFGKVTHTITVAPDALSEAASATCYAKNAANEEAASVEANEGENVKCYATAEEGYGFGGWYADGVLVSEDSPYEFEVEGPVSLTARYTAEVELAVAHAASADGTGTVSIDGGTAGATATANVLLGETCVIKAIGTAGSIFNAWHLTSDTGFESPIEGYLAEYTITVLDTTSLTARLVGVSNLETRYLAILNYDNKESAYNPSLGILHSSTGTEISKSEWDGFFGSAGLLGIGEEVAEHKYYKFTGSVASTLSAVSNSLLGFMQWESSYLIPVESPGYGEPHFTLSSPPVVIGTTPNIGIVSNRHYVITAVWGAPKPVLVRMMYASGNGISMGTLSMSPVTSERAVIQNGVSDKYAQGSDVVFSASPAGGCRFDGWYRDAACVNLESLSVSYTLRVVAPATLYAKFSQHSGSIYRWDSGTSAKMMLWRSKRYVAARPLSLSAARIYADAYPATLSVFTASSPEGPSNTDPDIRVSASRQDGFRLPMVRPEKYLELQVETNADVTDVAVATSMGGLNE